MQLLNTLYINTPRTQSLEHLFGSPVSDDGRGLKLLQVRRLPLIQRDRPSVMTGVD